MYAMHLFKVCNSYQMFPPILILKTLIHIYKVQKPLKAYSNHVYMCTIIERTGTH